MPLAGKNSPTMGLSALFFCCLRTVVTRTGGGTEVRLGGESKPSSGWQRGNWLLGIQHRPELDRCVSSYIQTQIWSTSACVDPLRAGLHPPVELCWAEVCEPQGQGPARLASTPKRYGAPICISSHFYYPKPQHHCCR